MRDAYNIRMNRIKNLQDMLFENIVAIYLSNYSNTKPYSDSIKKMAKKLGVPEKELKQALPLTCVIERLLLFFHKQDSNINFRETIK